MADSTSQLHGRGPQRVSSPLNASSPRSSAGSGGTPISFRTNVNRAKTKRWLEAKRYSYDGNDWGDDDDDQEEEAQPVPQAPYSSQRHGSTSDLSSKHLSGLADGADESRSSPTTGGGTDQGTLPFIRPADIYKRMREAQQPPTESGPRNEDSQSPVQPDNTPARADVETSNIPSKTTNSFSVGLPELKRFSGFNTDWINPPGTVSNLQQNTSSEQEPSLQHNPSQGFRSVVHQAFDVPETPDSTTGSVERSNSDGTSVVSPVIGARGFTDDRTPTIYEEPESPPPAGAMNEGPVLTLGHRRDLSVPSPGNSPSRKPVITDHDIPAAGQAERSSVSSQQDRNPPQLEPAEQSLDASKRASMQVPANTAEKDLPAPLNLGNTMPSRSDTRGGDIPIFVPSMETANSPQDADNDRLREEIIRSLSRENTPSDGPEHGARQSQTQAVNESRDEQTEATVATQDQNSNIQTPGGETSTATSDQPTKPKLGRKFSWESSSDEAEPQVSATLSAPPPLDAALSVQDSEPVRSEPVMLPQEYTPQLDAAGHDTSDAGRTDEKPQLSIIPPVAESSSPEQIGGSMTAPVPPHEMPRPTTGGQSIGESTLLGFRDILGIKSADSRIRAFTNTRDQFANLDTGLNHWIEFMVRENPEHVDLIDQSQKLSPGALRASPANRKFPKFTSLSNLASSLNDGTPTNTSHNRRPSGHHIGTVMNRQNVEQRGKDFLHQAGTFSGKAGEAAKGLFSKGKSKFRAGGGADKVPPPTADRRSLQFPFSSKSEGSNGNLLQRDSITFGNLPLFRSSRNELRTFGAGPDDKEPSKSSEFPRFLQAKTGNETSSQTGERPLPESPAAARRQSEVDYAGDLELEMISSLGLSPIDSRHQPSAGGPSTFTPSEVIKRDGHSSQMSLPQSSTSALSAPAPPTLNMDRSLPVVPDRVSGSFAVSDSKEQWDGDAAVETTASIRQVSTGKTKPAIPPKDVPPKDVPPKDVPPRDRAPVLEPIHTALNQPSVSSLGVDEHDKPFTPPKDLPPVLGPNSAGLSQASISSLGADELSSGHQDQYAQVYHKPAAPSQLPARGTGELASNKPLPQANTTEVPSGFGPIFPPGPPSFAQVPDSRKRSLSGVPETAPDVASPLRNEVKYSPATRSSIFSFGKQSASNRRSRPSTPMNDLSQHPEPREESTMGKLKNIGKRRRASVGDLLSGLQGGQKRAFRRISGIFGRQEESQHQEIQAAGPTADTGMPPTPLQTNRHANGLAGTAFSDPFADKPLPSEPASPAPVVSPQVQGQEAAPLPRDPRKRLSKPPPPVASYNNLTSSVPPVVTELSSAILSQVQGQPEGRPFQQRQDLEQQEKETLPQQEQRQGTQQEMQHRPPVPNPDSGVQSKNPVASGSQDPQSNTTTTAGNQTSAKNITVSDVSMVSSTDHPHRTEARAINDPPQQPVELALTKDDSSEEIVMSPTAYPGQEWTPTNF